MKVLLIQPPRKFWPYISAGDNFVMPLWMACIAGAIRQAGFEVRCIDCMAEQIGLKSLEKRLRDEAPDVICVSEAHTLYIKEAVRFIRMVRRTLPNVKIIGGGGHISNNAHEIILDVREIDFIVIGEGEATIVELLQHFQKDETEFGSVKGIVFRDGDKIVRTPPRPLIKDLDTLPMPAYDLMPVPKYGVSRFVFTPGGITIEHGRGCPVVCDFCVWWTAWAKREVNEEGKEELSGAWRTKSVKKTVDEIEHLKNVYGKDSFMFVDGTWNASQNWNREFALEIVRRGLKITFFAFVRADLLLRDEEAGVLELLVKAGLAHICIGIEHHKQETLNAWSKTFQKVTDPEKVLELFARKYPGVFLQGTFIVGSIDESRESIAELTEYIKTLPLDFPAIHILTPVPGSQVYADAVRDGRIEVFDTDEYDWNTPIMSTKHLTRDEILWEVYRLYKNTFSFLKILRGLLSTNSYRRNMYAWWLVVTLRIVAEDVKTALTSREPIFRLIEPSWYNR